MSGRLELLPEGAVLDGRYEIWKHLGEVPGGQLYSAVTAVDEKPARRLLLARFGHGDADQRTPGEAAAGTGVIPALLERLEVGAQEVLALDCSGAERVVDLAPVRDDETALAVLRVAVLVAAALHGRGASLDVLAAAHLAVRPDGRPVYLGPVLDRDPEEAPGPALAAVAGQLLAAEPWSPELEAWCARLVAEPDRPPDIWLAELDRLDGPDLTLSAGQATDTGPFRDRNDDAAMVLAQRLLGQTEERIDLAAVADGVGGLRDGHAAARTALTTLSSGFMMACAVAAMAGEALLEQGNCAVADAVRHAFSAADETVRALAAAGEAKGPGTTLVAAVRVGRRLCVGSVGDSRAYLWRGGELLRLTRDDSVVQNLLDQGQITAEEAYGHPASGVVTQCLGQGPAIRPACGLRLLLPGDRVLLCSDGLCEVLRDAQLAALLAEHPDAQEAAEALVTGARWAGSRDNVTAVVLNLEGA